jgi:uncharacterized protein (DUF1330 family)
VITLCVLLWAHEGKADDLRRYEDTVLGLIVEHGGSVISRVRCTSTDGGPDEVHVIQFPHEDAFDSYKADPRRQQLADERDRLIRQTTVMDAEVLIVQ